MGGQAAFELDDALIVPAGTDLKITLKANVSQFPDTVSGIAHTPNIPVTTSAQSAFASIFRGVDSNTAFTPTSWATVNATAQDVYRTKATVTLNSLSPSGTSVAGADKEVFRFDVTADANRAATVNNIAFKVAGSVVTEGSSTDEITGTGSVNLYDSTDLNTALETEAYQAVTYADNNGADGGAETDMEVIDVTTKCDRVPNNANVVISDGGAGGNNYSAIVDTLTELGGTGNDCVIALTTDPVADLDDGDIMYYFPLNAGNGRLYLGAMSTVTTAEEESTTTVAVTSTDGFAIGDTVTLKGFNTGGAASQSTGGCVITAATATVFTLTACTGLTAHATDDLSVLYLRETNTTGPTYEALTHKYWGLPVAYTELLNSNAGEEVSAGTTTTFVLKGDVTGKTTNDTIQVEINAAADFNWDDQLMELIVTDTKSIPVTGGTLIY